MDAKQRFERLLLRLEKLCLLIILAIGFALCLYGINYDLPFIYDQDEPMFVSRALGILKNRDPNPHWFGPPATTTIYLLVIVYAAIFAVGRVAGVFHSAEDFRALYYDNPSVFYLSGRIISTIFGVASIWLIYKIGRRIFGPGTGLVAAAILALSPVAIFLSQQVRMDAQMTFLVVLAFWYCLNIMDKRDWTSYLMAGFLIGLATVTKYPAIVFSLTIALTHFFSAPSLRLAEHRKLVGSASACIAGAFLGSPFVFIDFRTVLRDVIQEARPEHLNATGEGLLKNILWYTQGPLPNGLGTVGLVLAILGIVLCLTSKEKRRWVLVSFPILFLLFISSLSLRWERWILPVVPFLALLIALAITDLAGLLLKRFDYRLAVTTTALLLLALFFPLIRGSILHARQVSGPYTSTIARQWMLDHISGSRVLVEVYGPRLPASSFKVFEVNENGGVSEAAVLGANYEPGWEIGRIKDLDALAAQNIAYFVMTGYYQHFVDEKGKYPTQVLNYERLMSQSKLVYDIQSIAGLSRGPRVRIYQLPKATRPNDAESRLDDSLGLRLRAIQLWRWRSTV